MGISAFSQDPEMASDSGALRIVDKWFSEQHGNLIEMAFQRALDIFFDLPEGTKFPEYENNAGWAQFYRCAVDLSLVEVLINDRNKSELESLIRTFLHDSPLAQELTPSQRHFLERFEKTPFRLYQVTRVNPGKSITCIDVLEQDGAPIIIQESLLSENFEQGMFIGARLVDLATHKVITQGFLPIPPSSLHKVNAALEIHGANEESGIVQKSLAHVIGPALAHDMLNTEPVSLVDDDTDEPISLIEDRYEIIDRRELVKRMSENREEQQLGVCAWRRYAWNTVEERINKDAPPGLRMSSSLPGDRERGIITLSSISEEVVSPGILVVFHNTQKKAAQGKEWFEAVAGRSVRHRQRTVTDPAEVLMNLREKGTALPEVSGFGPGIPKDKMTPVMQQFYEEEYRDWAETPIPMLDNMTPLQACQTRAGQERVRGVINMYVSNEANFAARDKRKPASFKFLWTQVNLKP